MKIQKIIHSFFALIILSQLFVQPAHAQEAKPSIAFINQGDIEYSTKNLVEKFEVRILNQSPDTVAASQLTINIYIFGLEGILNTDEKQITISRGEIGTVIFSIEKEKVLNAPDIVSGFIAFGSAETGDIIYKTVTIDTRDKIQSAEIKDVVLLTEDGDISLNWTDLKDQKVRFPILNTSANPATVKADLYFLDQGKVIGPLSTINEVSQDAKTEQEPQYPLNCQNIDQNDKTVAGDTLCELIFDLSSLPLENKSYDVFLIVQVSNEYFLHKKITLNSPSAKALEPPGNPQVEFLGSEDSIAVNYGDLFTDQPVEIGIINKGEKSAQIKAEILILGLIDKDGKKISSFLRLAETTFSIEAQSIRAVTIQLEFDHTHWTNTETRQIPKEGTYNGYLILTTDYDNTPLIKPLSLSVETINPALPTAFAKLGEWIQLQWQKLPFVRTRFGAAEWSVFALIFALVLAWFFALIRVIRLWWWNIRGRLGPVIIEDIEGKPDLTAKFRQYLATSGIIPATSVPNVATGTTGFVTVVSKSKIPEVAFVQAILDFISGYLRIKFGYTVTSVLVGSEAKPPVGVTVQIKMTQNGRLKRIETIEGDSYEQAVKNAAYFIFHYISGRKTALRHIPEWSRFPTHTSYRLYKEADLLKGSQEYHKAVKLYEDASKEAPFNALLRLGWGDAYELKGEHLKALEVYLEAVSMWPHVLGFWYRISIILSYANKWYSKEWEKLDKVDTHKKGALLYLLNHNLSHIIPNPNLMGNNPVEFINVSSRICNYLKGQVSFGRMLRMWFVELAKNIGRFVFKPAELKPRLPLYYWSYIPFWPWDSGKRFQRMLELSKNCNDVISDDYKNDPNPNKPIENLLVRINNVENVISKPWNRMATYYNAACFYVLLTDTNQGLPHPLAYYQERAMNLLKTASQDPRSNLDSEWVKIDPDLASLHDNLEFKALFDIPGEEEKSKETKEKNAKYYALILVQKGVQQQLLLMKRWGGLKVSQAELLAGAEQQKRVWENLIKLAENPTDKVLQKLFWNLAMQFKNGSFKMPEEQDCQKSLDELNTCWKAIKDESQHQPEIWESHIADGKLYLEHGKSPMSDVWTLWSKAEIRQWEYIDKHIDDFKKAKDD